MSRDCCPPPAENRKGEEPSTSCCPPQGTGATGTSCCSRPPAPDRPGYRIWPFVCGWIQTPGATVPQVATTLGLEDLVGRWQMRWGLGRMRYSIAPGLYAVGTPTSGAPVLVTANYKMSFDALRSELGGLDAWILVLDTKGINVWCAAGKGTFGTAEIIRQAKATDLQALVGHRRLIVPQLGAPGVSAQQVRRGCGFEVIYGPVRASDLPAFLASGCRATAQMRQVSFTTVERLVLTPVELTGMLKSSLWALAALLLLGGIGPGIFSFAAMLERGGAAVLAGLAALLCGAVLTPVLLPWIPGRAFALKGAILGTLVGAAILALGPVRLGSPSALALTLAIPAISSWCAMNFTGSTTFTSPSGVEKEMRRAIPLQAAALLIAAGSWLYGAF